MTNGSSKARPEEAGMPHAKKGAKRASNERPDRENEQEPQGPVVRDRRRIDPETGAVREAEARETTAAAPAPGSAQTSEGPQVPGAGQKSGGAQGPGVGQEADEWAALRTQLAERTADLQRVQAEYANYRKRVDRDRVAVREQALANVLVELLPVLDDIGRAREHGELEGGFRQVAESLEKVVAGFGLESFGEKGEPFDPNVHEALMHSYSSEVTETTCTEILQPGYAVAGRVLRPARVAVADPEPEPAPEAEGSAEESQSTESAEAPGDKEADNDSADRGADQS